MLEKQQDYSFIMYLYLAFIAMAGLAYINFLPGVVNALAGGIGFSKAQAGGIVALNGYGGLVGMAVAVFLVRRIQWKPVILLLLAALAAVDTASIWIDRYSLMLGWRFLAGFFGGLCVGVAFAVLARLHNPDRAFGLLLLVQFVIGSLVIYLLPGLEVQFNARAVFCVMAGIVCLGFIFLLFIPALSPVGGTVKASASLPNVFGGASLLMLAIALYQSAASAIWAYAGLIGLNANIDAESVSTYIATTGMLGLPGAMLPVLGGNRFGRLYWIIAGVFLSIVAAVLLNALNPGTPSVISFYIIPMSLLFFSWPAVQSYLLAVTADMDDSGQLSTIAALVSCLGLASGPLLAASLLEEGSFSLTLYACVLIFLLSFVLLIRPVWVLEYKARTAVPSSDCS